MVGCGLLTPCAGPRPCTTAGLLLASRATYWVLLLLPCMVWALCLGAGVLHFEGLPTRKGAVQHALVWFDRHVFRTAAGATLLRVFVCVRVCVFEGHQEGRGAACAGVV